LSNDDLNGSKTQVMHPIYTDIYAGLPKAAPGDDVYTVHAWTRVLPKHCKSLRCTAGKSNSTGTIHLLTVMCSTS